MREGEEERGRGGNKGGVKEAGIFLLIEKYSWPARLHITDICII